MVVGLCTVELQIPHSASLKDKRQVVKSVVARVRNDYNVSIAEVDHQNSWQLATLGIACVSTDTKYIHGLLESVVQAISRGPYDLILLDYTIEML